jgi:hypothetical protein
VVVVVVVAVVMVVVVVIVDIDVDVLVVVVVVVVDSLLVVGVVVDVIVVVVMVVVVLVLVVVAVTMEVMFARFVRCIIDRGDNGGDALSCCNFRRFCHSCVPLGLRGDGYRCTSQVSDRSSQRQCIYGRSGCEHGR